MHEDMNPHPASRTWPQKVRQLLFSFTLQKTQGLGLLITILVLTKEQLIFSKMVSLSKTMAKCLPHLMVFDWHFTVMFVPKRTTFDSTIILPAQAIP